MKHNLDFLFLSEADAVKAGAGDIHTCIQVMDEVFDLLGQGDYLMGAPNHNSHGIKIYFPKETPFPGMPVKGPDRRFMALVGYLGGKFHVCGEKWYGSNLANREKGLPRSILTTVLNDPDTGAPLAIMSANALSAARTGAVGSGLVRENQKRGYYRPGRCGVRKSRGKTRRQGKGDFHYGWNADRGFGLGIYHLPECPGTGHWKQTESLGRLDVGQKAEGRKRRGDSGP